MNSFGEALIYSEKSPRIPEELDLFTQFVGEWDFDWYDRLGGHAGRQVKGEWIFSRVLEGTAIQDIFICPSRAERLQNNQPDAEYGTTIRIFNPKTSGWDIFYGCMGEATRLEARGEGDTIVLTEITDSKMKWVFSEISQNSFHWQHIRTEDGGLTWKTYGELFATRRA